MTYPVLVTRQAEAELAAAFAYLKADAPDEAKRWLSDLRQKLLSLGRYPQRCARLPDSRRDEELRQLVVGFFHVVFLFERESIYVLTIQRSGRLPLARRELERRLQEHKSPRKHSLRRSRQR